MTDNHTDDQHLLQQIEQALAGGQASGDPLLDTLASTQPQPTADFQTRLEARLMLAVQEQSRLSEEDVMSITEKPKREPKRWSARLPLTLAAVIAITLMGGSALMFMNNLGGPTPGFAAQAETHTPTFVSSLEPAFLTATSIIAEATRRANSTLEQMPPEVITATAQANQTTQARWVATKNALLSEFTATFAAAWTATAQANSTEIEPLMATVTVALAEGTATAQADRDYVQALTGLQAVLVARDTIRRGTPITVDMLTTIYVSPDLDFHVLQAERTIMAGEVSSAFDGTAEQAAGQYAMVDIPALSPLLANDLVPENPIGRLPRGLSYPMTIYAPAEMAQSLTPGDRAQIITDLSALLTGFSADQPRLLTLVDLVEVLEILPAEAGRAAVSVTMASNNDRQMVMDLLEWGVPLMLASPDFVIPAISDNGLTPTAAAEMAETLVLANEGWRMDLDENTRMVEVFIPLTDAPDNLIIGDNVGIQAEMNFRETANQTRIEIVSPAPQSAYRFHRFVAQPELLRVETDGLVVSMSQVEAVELSNALDAGVPLSLAYR